MVSTTREVSGRIGKILVFVYKAGVPDNVAPRALGFYLFFPLFWQVPFLFYFCICIGLFPFKSRQIKICLLAQNVIFTQMRKATNYISSTKTRDFIPERWRSCTAPNTTLIARSKRRCSYTSLVTNLAFRPARR